MTDPNLAKANTNSLKSFIHSHEDFANLSKVGGVGLAILKDEITNGAPSSSLWPRINSISEPWGTEPQFSEVIVERAYTEFANLGIAKSFSSFDKYLVDIDGELVSFSSFGNHGSSVPMEPLENEGDDLDSPRVSLAKIYERHSFDPLGIDFCLPVFSYYQSARNCIVHRDGLASRALAKSATAEALGATLTDWVKLTGEYGPLKLKLFEQDDAISLDYFDSILCYSVLRRLAQDIDKQAINRMGIDGLTFRAVRHMQTKWRSDEAEEIHSTATKSVASHLARFNRVIGSNWRSVEPRLKRMGLLDGCRKAFATRQGTKPS